MKALIDPAPLADMPIVAAWLANAEATRRIVKSRYGHLSGAELLEVLVAENVLVQIEHLRTQPAVAAALARGSVRLHAWVYAIESGEVFAYDGDEGQYARIEGKNVPVLQGIRNVRAPWS
jgi:carbonic anhydrase